MNYDDIQKIEKHLLWEDGKPTDYLRNVYIRWLLPEDEVAQYHAYIEFHPEENHLIHELQEATFGPVPAEVLAALDDDPVPGGSLADRVVQEVLAWIASLRGAGRLRPATASLSADLKDDPEMRKPVEDAVDEFERELRRLLEDGDPTETQIQALLQRYRLAREGEAALAEVERRLKAGA